MSLSECKTMGGNEHENVWTFIEKYSSNSPDISLMIPMLLFPNIDTYIILFRI